MPATISFRQLHVRLQLAFERDEEHTYHVTVKIVQNGEPRPRQILQRACCSCVSFTITLDGPLAVSHPHQRADHTTLQSILEDLLYAGREILYEWDLAALCEHINLCLAEEIHFRGTRLEWQFLQPRQL